ncbi:unnamed protein product [Camellia sinensis]
MEIKSLLLTLVALISFCSLVHSFEPSPLQDFCVADTDSSVRVNGFVCRNPMLAQASHFSLMGLNLPGNTSNPLGSAITPAIVAQFQGSTPSASPWSASTTLRGALTLLTSTLVPLKSSPSLKAPSRSASLLPTLKTVLLVVVQKGDVFVFPIGLIHYERNVGYGSAIAIAGLSSQNLGVITMANAVFRSKPMTSGDVLAKTFKVNMTVVDAIQEGM